MPSSNVQSPGDTSSKMGPILSEPPSPRPRRQPFIATCSPDELLGQVIQALCPRYNLDAPHLLALRQVLSTAIVAPRKPPTLKRTRPDKRIGEIVSIYDTPRHSPYGPNGPPVSATQSFSFHHKDPDFERLLPQVDRSRYERLDEPASQSSSDNAEVLDHQERVESIVSRTPPAVSAQCSASLQPTTPLTSTPTGGKQSSVPEQSQQPKQTLQEGTPEQVSTSKSLAISSASQKNASANFKEPDHPSIPAIIITNPESKSSNALSVHKDIAVPPSDLPETDIAIELPEAQDTGRFPEPSTTSVSHIAQITDTQDTVNSTQHSEVFSQPVEFVHFTPPSQADTQDMALSQVDPPFPMEPGTADKTEAKVPRRSHRCSLPSSWQPSSFVPALGKRSRARTETAEERPGLKRSK